MCGLTTVYVDLRCVNDNDELEAYDKCDAVATAASTNTEFDLSAAVRPSTIQTCSVPCDVTSSQCVFSQWTAWSPCSHRCDGVSSRFRFMEGRSASFHTHSHTIQSTAQRGNNSSYKMWLGYKTIPYIYLRCSELNLETFKRHLKTFLFAHY